ncbi:MAG: electron transport complex subunit RsxC [Victivallales bacterium]|nr:electron transport complex subunit RsxC [Victivallales bacterium]MBR6075524.1 electron transport complex subunit RsxC [Victivallales bacterium]
MITQIRFYGGIHPSEGKVSNKEDIINAPLQELYTVPLQQHIGAPAKMVVQKGDHVLRGQLLGEPGGFVSAAVHSPTSGTVKDVTTCLGPAGATLPAVVIESDGEDKAADPLPPFENWQDADPAALKARVGEAGIVGMGGATFPTFVKLSPPPNVKIDTIILDGVECEPCLTADHRLMLETPEKIVKGAQIIGRILGVKRIIIAIELNKPDAIETMTKAAEGTGVEVAPLVVRYPQGAEKQLIYALTGRKVPSGGLPAAVGCVVSNVGTTAAIYEAVCLGKPLYERVTTVTGTPVVKPGNYRFRVGTLYRTALELCGGVSEDPAKIISGGPMMGMAVYSLDIPVMKGTSGILLLSRDELVQYSPSACLRCGRCNDVCPMSMMPGILSAQIEHQKFELAEKWHVMDCIECGSCAYICPAGRPLVQHMRRAKAVVNAKKRAAAAAAAAAAKK